MNKKAEIKNRIDLINRGEVPEGYKCCWGYIYPESWNIKSLKDLFYKVKTKNAANESLPVLTNSATLGVILQDEYFDREIVNDENTNNYYIVENGDFMYNPRISSNAPAGPINRNTLGQKGIASPLYTIFRAKDTKNIEFVEKYFKSNYWHRYMKSVSNQGARHDRLNINDEDFMRMPIPQPSKQEQEKIAKILNCCDKVIELKEKLLVEIKRYNQSLRSCLFNFEEINKTKPYITKKMGEITKIQTGNSNTQDKIANGKYPFFVRSKIIERTNKYSYDGEAILIPGDGEIGKIFHYINGKFDYHQRVYKISDFKNVYGKFIYYYLLEFFEKHAQKYTAKATVDSLRLPMLTDFVIKFPNNQEQKRIICILDKVESIIYLLEQELEQYKQLKKSLSQLLLTGIVRTVEADCAN